MREEKARLLLLFGYGNHAAPMVYRLLPKMETQTVKIKRKGLGYPSTFFNRNKLFSPCSVNFEVSDNFSNEEPHGHLIVMAGSSVVRHRLPLHTDCILSAKKDALNYSLRLPLPVLCRGVRH